MKQKEVCYFSALTGSDSLSVAVRKTALANSSRNNDTRLLKVEKLIVPARG